MKTKFFKGISAAFALVMVALATTFTSCEKEEFNVEVKPANAQAVVTPMVLFVNAEGNVMDVTTDATITPNSAELTFTGNPALEAKTVDITAEYTYNDNIVNKAVTVSKTITVNIPALKAGQYANIPATLTLQAKGSEVTFSESYGTPSVDKLTEVNVDNQSNYYWTTNRWYMSENGKLIEEENKSIKFEAAATSFDKMYVRNFMATLKYTYSKEKKNVNFIVYPHSRTTIYVNKQTTTTTVTFNKNITVDGKTTSQKIATLTYKDFMTEFVEIKTLQQIPGHGHAPVHGHGDGHGDDANAGGGIFGAE